MSKSNERKPKRPRLKKQVTKVTCNKTQKVVKVKERIINA